MIATEVVIFLRMKLCKCFRICTASLIVATPMRRRKSSIFRLWFAQSYCALSTLWTEFLPSLRRRSELLILSASAHSPNNTLPCCSQRSSYNIHYAWKSSASAFGSVPPIDELKYPKADIFPWQSSLNWYYRPASSFFPRLIALLCSFPVLR